VIHLTEANPKGNSHYQTHFSLDKKKTPGSCIQQQCEEGMKDNVSDLLTNSLDAFHIMKADTRQITKEFDMSTIHCIICTEGKSIFCEKSEFSSVLGRTEKPNHILALIPKKVK